MCYVCGFCFGSNAPDGRTIEEDVVSEYVGAKATVFSVMEVALLGLHHGNRGSNA